MNGKTNFGAHQGNPLAVRPWPMLRDYRYSMSGPGVRTIPTAVSTSPKAAAAEATANGFTTTHATVASCALVGREMSRKKVAGAVRSRQL
jgi:hypothetical protein